MTKKMSKIDGANKSISGNGRALKGADGKKFAVKSAGGQNRAVWSSKWAFIASAAASAVGLGNFWRFPFLAAKFGGSLFLITYGFFVFTIGISLLLLENAFGRKTGKSVIEAFRDISQKHVWVGYLCTLIPLIIIPYYCVVGGWVTKYCEAYFVNSASSLADDGLYFQDFISNNSYSFIFVAIFILITFFIVIRGVNKGIEKANVILLPTLLILSIALAAYICFLPNASEGVAYYLIPDFSKMSSELLINALGQTFYSLSLAMGIMITYGSYVDKKDKLTTSVVRIALASFFVSFIAGMIIVPAAFAATGSPPTDAGPSLMFVVLPNIFETMGVAARPIGAIFFILVFFAAITSSISIFECCVSIISDTFKITRLQSTIIVGIFSFVFAFIVNCGYGFLSDFKPLGLSILAFCDEITNSFLMPIVAILTCLVLGWFAKPNYLVDEISSSQTFKLDKVWFFIIKFIAPILITIILIANILSFF